MLHSVYTKFIVLFLGAFLVSILAAGLFASVTQVQGIQGIVLGAVEERAERIRALVVEEGMPVGKARDYLATSDIGITVSDTLGGTGVDFTRRERDEMARGRVVVLRRPDKRGFMLAALELEGKYVVVSPDRANLLSQFRQLQKTTILIPIFVGAILIVFAVAKAVKPIKRVSAAAREVAAGNFDVELEVGGKDEIAGLIRNFNLMVKELSANEYLHKEFVGNVSHEFKTPMTSIIGYAKLLRKPGLSDERRREYAGIIVAEGERLAKLSSNLLRLSELDNGVIRPKSEAFRLDEQIRDALILLQGEWEAKNLTIEPDLDEATYTGDRELMYQVWLNLISNAIKFTDDNGTITVNLRKDDVITVEVIDTGIGMSDGELDKVFLRFHQADKSRNTAGTGLGLPIAKRIVELHGGTVSVESSVGKGSKFTVRL